MGDIKRAVDENVERGKWDISRKDMMNIMW